MEKNLNKTEKFCEKKSCENELIFPLEEASVSCPGAMGSFSEEATNCFVKKAEITFCDEFKKVFENVDNGATKYGVAPIENSTAGSVNEVYSLLKDYGLFIVADKVISISHNLLAVAGATKKTIRTVYSHYQALAQCKDYLRRNNYVGAEYSNTALSAMKVRDSSDITIGAIASLRAGQNCGLQVLERGIEDRKNNYTRFILISKTQNIMATSKLSILASLPDEKNALYNLLGIIAKYNKNLLKLESRPSTETFVFDFYLDIACDYFEGESMLNELKKYCKKYAFLGSYNSL